MLKSYIKKIVKSELVEEKLNKSYGKHKSLVMYFNDTIHRQNNELSKLYNTNSSLKETIENLEGKLILKGNLLSGLKQEYVKLKQENEKLEESTKNLGGTLSLKDNLLNEKNKEIEELKEENKHLKITLKLSKNKILELKDLYEQEKDKNYKTLESEELKQEIEKLKKENEKLNIDKEVLKVALEESKNYVAYLEKEDKKLNEKLDGIKCVIKKQRLSALTYGKLKKTFILVERYLKES